MEQALTLKGFADNKSEQRAFVEARDALFEHLLSVVEKGMIDQYQNSNAIKQEFGEPLLVTQVMHQGEMRTRWLYRYQTQAFSSPKVYLIFNNHGVLEEWELVPAPQSNEE